MLIPYNFDALNEWRKLKAISKASKKRNRA